MRRFCLREAPLGARTRRAAAAVAILLYLAAYIAGAVTLADRLPNVLWIRLAYFVAAGFLWVIPVMPILTWAEHGGATTREDGKRR
jgi:uncharacterized membrane protein